MRYDLGQLRVEKLIVHEVPWHVASSQTAQGPVLSDDESPLTDEIRHFFRERIASSLGFAAYEVEFDPGTTSPIPGLVKSTLADSSELVADSQQMANHLFLSQKGSNPAGLLTVVAVHIAGKPGICVLKLEKEEGARVLTEIHDGKKVLSVDHIRELMLTQKTKVFKVGLFVKEGGSGSETAEGLVSDKQMGFGTPVADFFLRQFLGCRLKQQPDIMTRQFFEAAETFINDDIADPADKARYQIAVLAEMNSSKTQVSIASFATEHLLTEHRQQFEDRVTEAGVEPTLVKDTRLIKTHLQRIRIDFESRATVLAPPETIGDQVVIDETQDGRTRVQITDRLKGMHGRSR